MATVSVDNTSNNQSIVVRTIPVEAQYAAGRVIPSEVLGSTSEGSGPTTGQISPRY